MKSLFLAILFGMTAYVMAEDLPPGHPTVKDALEAVGKQAPGDVSALPNQGTVVSTLQSRGYTYIEVEHAGKNIWLAAPQIKLADGAKIRFGEGITMANFYSNGLKREFEQIFFVDRVEAVK